MILLVKYLWSSYADGRALAVGGMGADLLPRSILQQYDIRKDVWALLPAMPTPRYDANTHLLGNKLYVAGTMHLLLMDECFTHSQSLE